MNNDIKPGVKSKAGSPQLSVAFILLPNFTLLPFSAFIDALRLAADEGDKSRQINCSWTVMGENLDHVTSSSGVQVQPWETFSDPENFDYIVVVGGLLHDSPVASNAVIRYLQLASDKHITLVGLCTGSFALIKAGLMKGRRCCVSWFHYQDLIDEREGVIAVADQLYVDDGDRITCAGGVIAADLAASIIERHLGRNWARKSLRIMGMEKPRLATSPQSQPASEHETQNKWVKRALLLLEQNLSQPISNEEIAAKLNLSKRHLERLFISETGESLQKYYRNLRLNYGLWLLQNSNRTVTDISQECGFSDTAHFSRTFKATFNAQPSTYRTVP